MNYGTKVQLLTILNHILLVAGILVTEDWTYVYVGLICYIFTGLLSANISMHRYLSHKSFETGYYRDKFLKYISVLACFGSPISWCALHRHHHQHSDTENDIQNPKLIGPLKSWASIYNQTIISPKLVKDLIVDSDVKFIHKCYFHIIGTLYTIMFLIDPMLLVWTLVFPAVMCFHGASTIGVIPHYKWSGYKVADSGDDSVNSPIASLLSLGEGWHNYHHHNSKDYRHGHKWWEIDPSAFIIERIFNENSR